MVSGGDMGSTVDVEPRGRRPLQCADERTIAGDVAKDSGWKCKHPGQGNHKQIVVCPHEETVLLSNERAND